MIPPHDNDGWLDTANTSQRQILDLREAGMRHALTLGRFRYNHASSPLAEQCHRSWLVLVFVLAGSQRYRIDGREIEARGGQGLRILPGQRYGTGAWPEQRGELAWLILKVRPMPNGRALGMEPANLRSVLERLCSPDAPSLFTQPTDIPSMVSSAFGAWDIQDKTLRSEIVRNRIAALVLGSALALETEDSSNSAIGYRIQKALRLMNETLDEPPPLESFAKAAGLSPSHFSKAFKAITGTTPGDHLLRLRVEEAARRLAADPGLNVTQVAFDLGFSSSQYFATVFRRYLGGSPSTWRDHSLKNPKSR